VAWRATQAGDKANAAGVMLEARVVQPAGSGKEPRVLFCHLPAFSKGIKKTGVPLALARRPHELARLESHRGAPTSRRQPLFHEDASLVPASSTY
jgi:hypothetical protein